MRKIMTVILAAVLCAAFAAGCDGEAGVSNALLPGTQGIKQIAVSTMPQMHEAMFYGENAVKLADYILRMDVQTEFSEDPNVFTGMTWVFTVHYEDGSAVTVELFGNLFVRTDNGPWHKVSANAAEGLETMVYKLS